MTTFNAKPALRPVMRLGALALAAAGAIALAGCENPQPTAAPEQATAAPSGPDANLMGAPTPGAPVGPQGPSYPPPGYGQGYPPPPPGYGQPYPPTAYPPGYGHMTGPGAPGQIIAMQPIPNPPENGWYYGRHYGEWRGHAHRHHVYIYGGGAPVYAGHAWRHRHHVFHRAAAPAPAPAPVHRAAPVHHAAPAHPAAPAHHVPVAPTGAAAVGAAQLVKPHAPAGRHHHGGDQTAAAAAGGPTNTSANAADNETGNVTGTEADRYKALEASLHDAFESGAVLTVPANMPAGQASTVTLTLPADFAATAQKDAAQQGLSDAAASMNLLATLSGDGYTITPVEAQTVAMTANQPASFQWQVTPGAGAKAPLKANVRAQAVSAGQFLNLGDKTQGDGTMAGKVVGIGLLVLIAALILIWAVRRKPTRTQTVIRRPAYDQYTPGPPNT